jgi:hypothetical protein
LILGNGKEIEEWGGEKDSGSIFGESDVGKGLDLIEDPFAWLPTSNPTFNPNSSMESNSVKKPLQSLPQNRKARSVTITTPVKDRMDEKKKTPVSTSSLLNVIVSVVSPRILLLEDPLSADSRAIVMRYGVVRVRVRLELGLEVGL